MRAAIFDEDVIPHHVLITSSWTRVFSRRDLRLSWNASVELSPACREEVRVRWWLWNLCPVNGRAICPHPGPARIDSHVFADSSDTGAGAVILLEGPEAAASSVVQALRPMAPLDMSNDELIERASRGIEFMTTFHPLDGAGSG